MVLAAEKKEIFAEKVQRSFNGNATGLGAGMKVTHAVDIFKRHNEWRRGAEVEPIHPTQLGVAIGTVTAFYDGHKDAINALDDAKNG